MLDLTKRVNKYEIKWFDGQVLHLDMPTQALLMDVMEMENIEDTKEQFIFLVDTLHKIVSKNAEGRTFTKEEIASLPIDIIELILTDYVGTITNSLGE